jgi:stage II sporulation SpoE-like protein/phosphoserine phosphatase RsbU-like protein
MAWVAAGYYRYVDRNPGLTGGRDAPLVLPRSTARGVESVTTFPDRFRDRYSTAFEEYLDRSTEDALHAAYELGREAVARDLSMLDVVALHHSVFGATLASVGPRDSKATVEAAADLLLQTLSAFEMVQRGFREAQVAATLEKRHAEQLRQLADAFVAINSCLSVRDVVDLVTKHAAAILGEHCCVASLAGEGQRTQLEAIALAQPAGGSALQIDASLAKEIDAFASGLGRAARLSAGDVEEARWPELGPDSQHFGDLVVVPLQNQRDDHMGFVLILKRKGAFSEKDESIAIQLAEMLSASIENVRLYEREHRIAETLQQSLLPVQLPEPAGISVAVRYVPGAAGVDVGGDWFDVISLPNDRTGIAVGDVMGRGVRAASIMGQMRTAFRAYALDGSDPGSVVKRLNDLIPSLDHDHFSTMVYVVWDPAQRVARVVTAGHPPALLLDSGGTRYLDDAVSIALGVDPDAEYQHADVSIPPRSTLVLYTDGLVEHNQDLDDGFSRLQKVVTPRVPDLDALCDVVLKEMLSARPTDDAALLVLMFE